MKFYLLAAMLPIAAMSQTASASAPEATKYGVEVLVSVTRAIYENTNLSDLELERVAPNVKNSVNAAMYVSVRDFNVTNVEAAEALMHSVKIVDKISDLNDDAKNFVLGIAVKELAKYGVERDK